MLRTAHLGLVGFDTPQVTPECRDRHAASPGRARTRAHMAPMCLR